MSGGVVFDHRRSDLTSTSEAVGMLKSGVITQEEFDSLEETCCSSCGSCSFYGTANTMCALSEALGMSLPGCAMIPASHPDRLRMALKTGEAICNLVHNQITTRQIITSDAIENALSVCLATSGSTNAVIHLSAIAYEAGLSMSVMDTLEKLIPITPVIARVNPSAAPDMGDFYHAGGIPRVLEQLNRHDLIHSDSLTVSGQTIRENIQQYHYKYPENTDVIRPVEKAFDTRGGLAVVRGNIAPSTGITKPGAIHPSVLSFTGKARVFDCEEDAEKAILSKEIQPGTVLVIRYEGPKGGPGMREMYKAMKYLHGLGLSTSTAIITDGRFSGTNNGCFVGHISPEAADGGPIGLLKNGDIIHIDIPNGTLNAELTKSEWKERADNWTCKPSKFQRGYLASYSRNVSSADLGAIVR